jgi:hypothetical protein
MGLFGAKMKGPQYHADEKAADWALDNASDEQLEKWGSDPNCIEREKCAAYLVKRRAKRAADEAERQKVIAARQEERRAVLSAKRQELEDNPFDPRTEVSADAKHIASKVVTHLWILFVALPLMLAILFSILK